MKGHIKKARGKGSKGLTEYRDDLTLLKIPLKETQRDRKRKRKRRKKRECVKELRDKRHKEKKEKKQ